MSNDFEMGRQVAQYLLQIKAVVLKPNDPFTWASGWKSPIYCDNRLVLSYPEIRDAVAEAFANEIREKYPNAKSISGVATGGIAQGALVAAKLGLPMTYVRSSAKGHGRQNQVEGVVNQGEETVVIEDLISTGGSSLKAVDALREAGAKVSGLVAIFTYGFQKSIDAFSEAKVPFSTLTNYSLLIEEAQKLGYVSAEQVESLNEWRQAPDQWAV
jgi:orotate phosphoribosyltransferase